MKKGLLSILAGALVLVGCQNYDDQFDNLESQISALASTVAGLSQVQSDLASLAGTVSSLASTVNGLGDTIDTAVADGLTDIQADIDAIETAVADVASSEEVSSLSDAVAASQDDLQTLLDNASVFQGDVIVNNTATLETFHALKGTLAIVNGYVDIDAKADMDATKLQELVDAIQVTTKQFDYQAAASTVPVVTFNNLSGTQTLTVLQAGDYLFQGLGSATVINLKDDFKSKVTKIDFRELTSVAKFQTSGTDNTISFNKAMELHLTKLAFYAPLDLTIVTDEGAAMPFIIDDVDVDGDQSNISLDITGPASFTATNLTDGDLTFKDVATVDVDGFEGSFEIKSGVESFSADKVSALTISGAADLETLDITGITDPDSTTDQSGPAVTLTDANNGDLETVTIAGNTGAIAVAGDKVTTVTISADAAGSIAVSDSDDLATLTLTGSKATGVTVSGNDSLASLTIDTTITKGRGATAAATAALKVNGSVVVTTNESLESLTITSSSLKTLTITGNEVLSSLTADGIAAVGATAGAAVNIYGNNFTASKSADSENTASTKTATGEANDLGKFTTASGLDSLKAYLALVVADTKATANVYFDTVESYVGEDGVEDGTDATYSSETTRDTTTANNEQRILVIAPSNAEAADSAIAAKRAFYIDLSVINSDTDIQFTDGTNNLLTTATDATATATAPSFGAADTPQTALAKLQVGASVARAAIYNIVYEAKRGGNNKGTVTFTELPASTSTPTTVYERYRLATGATKLGAVSSTSYGVGLDDEITFSVGGNTVTVSPGYAGGTATSVTGIAASIATAWTYKYGPTGKSSGSAIVTVTASAGVLTVAGLSGDSASYDKEMKVSVSAGKTTATDAKNLEWTIGTTSDPNDNNTVDQDVILTFESATAGINLNKVSGLASATGGSSTVAVELFNTKKTNTSIADGSGETVGYVAAQEARTDVVNPESDTAAVANTAASFSRVHWL